MAESVLLHKGQFSRASPVCHGGISVGVCEVLNVPLFVPIRRLNDNDISVLEAIGLFKKLPNLRKM